MRSAESLHSEAVELANRGRRSRAERMLLQAAARTDDPNLLARIQATIAVGRAHRGELDDAVERCAEALRTPGLDAVTSALLAGQMGSILELAGRLDEASRWLSRAISAVGDPVARANLLVNRGIVGIQLRRLDAAARDTAEASAAFAAHGRPVDAAEARHNLGYIHLLRGDLVAALSEMSAARGVIAASSAITGAVVDVDRAEVLRDAGLPREAEAILAKAAGVLGANRMPRVRAEAELILARSLLAHDPVRARPVARAAVRRFEAIGNETWATRARAVRLRAELSAGRFSQGAGRAETGRRVPSAEEVDAVASALDRLGLRSDGAVLRLSRELWAVRRGVSETGRAAPRVPPRASMEVRLLTHEVRGARAAAAGRDGEARRHAARGLDLLSEWQSDFGSLDLQTSVAMHGNGLIFIGLDAAVRSRRAAAVFEWSERARHLSLQVVPLRPPPDAELAEELAELRMLRADDPAALESSRAAQLRERARERQWAGTRSSAFEERIELDGLRAHLVDGTAFIAFVYSGLGLSAVVVTTRGERLIDIAGWPHVRRALPGLRADLDMSAAMRAGTMGDVVRRSLDDRLAALSSALLDDVLAAAGDARRVVVTAPGILNGMPWTMLPGMRGRSFTLAASATRWAGLHAAPAPAPGSVALVAGPRVARAEEEIEDAARSWGSFRMLRGAEASVASVTGVAQEVDVLHVAAHGRHAVDNPLFSGLELVDGTLFGYDIDLIPTVPQTVVLSACEVGRSSVRWGEEAIGMTRVWLHAGARCVIASPVVVADDDACELLGAMHEGLARGEAPSDALAAATERTGVRAPFQAHGSGF